MTTSPANANSLPAELWSTVFVLCLQFRLIGAEDELVNPKRFRVWDPQLTLTAVCREWRHIACSTPQFWTTCWLSLKHPELNTIRLGRAGSLPLNLLGIFKNNRAIDWDPLIHSILPFQTRWTSFSVSIAPCYTTDYSGVMSITPNFNTPELKKFKLAIGAKPIWTEGLLRGSPNLQELELPKLPSTTVDILPRFLTRVNIHIATPKTIYHLLSNLPQLRYLDTYMVDEGDNLDDSDLLTHTNLTTLRLGVDYSEPFLLNQLTLPSLHTLHLFCDSMPNMDSIHALVDRSGCCIKELSLEDILHPDMMTLLQDVSISDSIEKLKISYDEEEFSPELIQFLRRQDTPSLPHLTHLSLSNHTFHDDIEDGLLADLVISRCRSRKCKCDNCCTRTPTREVSLRYFRITDGLDINSHALDIARLVPLPGDTVEDPKDAEIVLELAFVDWALFSFIPLRQFLIGKPSTQKGGFNDLL